MATTATRNQGTDRVDGWQVEPILAGLALVVFIIYATFRALQNDPSQFPGTHYISPLYTPYLPHWAEMFGLHLPFLEKVPGNGNMGWILSPALFILWVPAGFRATCYFYRRVYYRSLFTAPAACAVDVNPKSPLIALLGSGKKYMGEKALPMVLMNLHRYFFYLAAAFIGLHSIDVICSYFSPGFTGIRLGVGSLIITLDVVLLSLYVFSCHSWRHILGGQIDCFSSCPINEARGHAFQRQSILNAKHGLFGWVSLGFVIVADIYLTALSRGIIPANFDRIFEFSWKGMF